MEAVGRYRIERALSRGGMAQVYLAQDPESGRKVALKVLLPQVAEDPEFRLRFRHEAQAQHALRHPNIVALYDWGEGESPYLAMELVEGVTLKQLLAQCKRLPPAAAVHVVVEALRGIAHAHAAGVIHRDMKPSNIMISSAGEVKIADFGIATAETFTRLTQTGHIIGTPAYMSPEQARGEHTDKRTDLFSLGVILYEVLVGSNPFQADHPATTLNRVIEREQTPIFELNPSIPAELEAVVDNLMEKRILLRYTDAEEALRDLETVRSARIQEPFGATELAAYVADPAGHGSRVEKQIARRHYERGMELYKEGRGSPDLAIWELYQAVVIDPQLKDAKDALQIVSEQRGYRLQASGDPEIGKLKERVEKEPGNANLLVQLAKLYKKEGNFLQVIRCYVRLRKLHTRDPYLQSQMGTLVGAENLEAFDRTRSLVARRAAPQVTGAVAPQLAPGLAIPGPRVKLPPRPFEEEEGAGRPRAAAVSWPLIALVGGAVLVALLVRTLVTSGARQPELVGKGELARDIGEAMDANAGSGSAPAAPGPELMQRAAAMMKENPRRAQEMYERFLAEHAGDPREGEAALGLARALEAQGMRDEALERSYQSLPRMQGKVRRDAHRLRAKVLLSRGDVDEAVAEHDAIEALGDPVDAVTALVDGAAILAGAGRLDEAVTRLETVDAAYGSRKEAEGARVTLAELYLKAGRSGDAVAMARKVQASASVDAPAYGKAQAVIDAAAAGTDGSAPPTPGASPSSGGSTEPGEGEAAATSDEPSGEGAEG